MVEEIKSAFEGIKSEVNGAIESAKADNASALESVKAELEATKASITVVKDEIEKLEAKQNRVKMNQTEVKGFNATLADAIENNSDSLAKLARGEQKRSSFILDTKAVGNMTEAVNLTGDITRQYANQVYALPSREVHMRSLLPIGSLSQGLFTFPYESGGEGAPAAQTQGSAKAQVDFDITMKDAAAQYIAGYVRISRQMLDDIPAMTSFLQSRLLEKYLVAEDAQILSGDGTAPNLQGILPVATAATGAATVDVEQLVQAIAQLETSNYSATGILVNPTDWAAIMNTKNTNSAYTLPASTVVSIPSKIKVRNYLNTFVFEKGNVFPAFHHVKVKITLVD
jgi:HK97 family phage major capsid protein